MIRASAGSGKTYRLVRRLISLLADGEAPDSILAATFSRKAAGEFRAKLLSALATAVEDREASQTLSDEIGCPGWGTDDYRTLLSSLVRDPDLLRLSTIDAFFLELIGLFRFELGLGANVFLGSETGEEFEIRDLLRTIFTAAEEDTRKALFHLVEEDRGDDSVRSFQAVLEEWIKSALSLYRQCPDSEKWGKLPDGLTLPKVTPEEWTKRLSLFTQRLNEESIAEQSQPAVQELIAHLQNWDFSPVLPKEYAKWIKAGAVDQEKLLLGKKGFIINRKKITLSPSTGEALISLAEIFYANAVQLAVGNTKGAHKFLAHFETENEARRLSVGHLRFEDLPFLLRNLDSPEGSLLAYRLDARLKHWLLDEFQDTSRSQWEVLHPFIEELFYDCEEPRTFFCVGDPKQAIYGWRKGDSRLFKEIAAKYSAFEPRPLVVESIAKTYRCSPPIVEFINQLFGSREAFPKDLNENVASRWLDQWELHQSAKEFPLGIVEVESFPDKESPDELILNRLRANSHRKSDRSVAILCRTNKTADHFDALLRENGIPTVRDGALSITRDFSSGRLIYAIFNVLLCPGNTLALGVLTSSSAVSSIEQFCGGKISPQSLRKKWESLPLPQFLADFESCLSSGGWIDSSEHRCLEAVYTILREAKSKEGPELKEIVQTLSHSRLEDPGSASGVQIMTIHRSKGLEFDTVFLPDLAPGPGIAPHKELWVSEEEGRITAVLERVNQDAQAIFPPLREWGDKVAEDRTFESLCVTYVAATRAVEELYVYCPKRKSFLSQWIEKAFSPDPEDVPLVKIGEPVESTPPKPVFKAPPEPSPPVLEKTLSSSLRRDLSPSKKGSGEASSLFLPDKMALLEFGTKVHRVLASFEWPASDWDPKTADPDVRPILSQAFAHDSIRELLSRPQNPTEVWRERAFDARIEDTWVSGVFDRVHQRWPKPNEKSRPLIIDFKTDSSPQEIPQSYRDQLLTYRKALAMILSTDTDQIDAKLVFLRSGEIVPV